MKYLYISALILLTFDIFACEITENIYFSDKNDLLSPDTLAVVQKIYAGSEKDRFLIDSLQYFDNADSVKNFVIRKNAIGPFESSLDFNDHALILAAYTGVDCHSKFEIYLYDSPVTKEYIFSVKVIDGGCRAGGNYYANWFKIPKLPKGYKLVYHWYYEKNN